MTNDSENRRPRLVLGDDGAGFADRAWEWLATHAWPGWHVEVMTAFPDESQIDWGRPPRIEEWTPSWQRAPEALEGAAEVRFLKVATDPRAMLAEVDADLVVVGVRAETYLEGLVTGSTTEWLLHHPPSPLLVARTSLPTKKVLVCVDGSAHSLHAVEAFTRLPLAVDADVTAVAVEDGRTDTSSALRSVDGLLEGKVASVSTVSEQGHPGSVILNRLEGDHYDLVVLGTRGLTGWRRLRLGSTASGVVRGSECNSLVASAGEG